MSVLGGGVEIQEKKDNSVDEAGSMFLGITKSCVNQRGKNLAY